MMSVGISDGETALAGTRARLAPMSGRPDHPTRRSLLLAAAALPLAGCGIRLERDAPEIPGVPTATPPADTRVMQDAITRLRAVADAIAGQQPDAWTTPLRRWHTDQADRLTEVAASAGIEITAGATATESTGSPSSTATATATATATSTSSPVTTEPVPTSAGPDATGTAGEHSATTSASRSGTTSTTVTTYPAAATELAALTPAAITAAAAASAPHRPALLATLAGHRAAARLLGRTDLPTGTGLPPAAAAVVLEPVRACVYVAELLIAKTAAKDRGDLSALLTRLYAERMRLGVEAGAAAKPEQLSYELSADQQDPSKAPATMTQLLQETVNAVASQAGSASDARSATRLVQLWGDLAATAWQWGRAPSTFLGLT